MNNSKHGHHHHHPVLSALLVVFLATCLPLFGESTVLKGRLSVQYFLNFNLPKATRTDNGEFEIELDAGAWKIKFKGPQGTEFACYDGADNYRYQELELTGRNSAVVGTGNYPLFSLPHLKVIWLAYCSSGHFSNGTNWMHAPWISRDIPTASSFTYRLLASNSPPLLPMQLEFYGSTNQWGKEASRTTAKLQNRPSPVREKEVYGVYQSSGQLEFAGNTFPRGFVLTRYRFTSGGDRKVLEIYTGSLLSATNQPSSRILPPVTKPFPVADYRFEDEKRYGLHAVYVVTNEWPARTEAYVTDAASVALRRYDREHASLRTKTFATKSLTLLTLAAMAGIPLLLLYQHQNRKVKQQATKHTPTV